MKNTLFNWMRAFLLACIMCFGMCTTALAAETNTNDDIVVLENSVNPRGSIIVDAGATGSFEVGSITLAAYKKLDIITASKASDSQYITWELKNGSTTVLSGTTGVNSSYLSNDMWLIGGTYKLRVTNHASKATTVHAFFQ